MKSLLLVLATLRAANACRFPPSLWCDSKEIAVECRVFDQCMKSVWRRDEVNAPLVDLELYFESECPGCQDFITSQLYPTFTKIGAIMNITLVPYGNAKERKEGDHWKFMCQHGEGECVGNMLETCAIHLMKGDMNKIMPFINCVESYVESSEYEPMKAVKVCAHKLGAPLDQILQCYNSSEGNRLEHEMALRTEALKPPHQYVPWVVLNGVHTEKMSDEAMKDLLKLVCDTYTGPKPAACKMPEMKEVCKRPLTFQKNGHDLASFSLQ